MQIPLHMTVSIASLLLLAGCTMGPEPIWESSIAGSGGWIANGAGGSASDGVGGTTDPGNGGSPQSTGGAGGSNAPAGSGGSAGTEPAKPDYSNIARVALPSSWTANSDGTWSYPPYEQGPFNVIGQAFYANHPDDYDFLAIFTEGDLLDFGALAIVMQCNIQGLGMDPYGCTFPPSDAGSAGRLQQMSIMNAPHWWADWGGDASIMVHEMTHRWAAYVQLAGTPQMNYLEDGYGGHWNVHVNTGGPSAVGYGDLSDLGGGNFKFQMIYPLHLSPLELYLAGLISASEVPPLFYVANATNHSPATDYLTQQPMNQYSYGQDVTFSGTRVDFTIDDIIATNGQRLPAVGDAQTHFRYAFVMVCADVNACKESDLAVVEAQRQGLPGSVTLATGGRASVETGL